MFIKIPILFHFYNAELVSFRRVFFRIVQEFFRVSIVTISGVSGTPHVVNVGFHYSQEKYVGSNGTKSKNMHCGPNFVMNLYVVHSEDDIDEFLRI